MVIGKGNNYELIKQYFELNTQHTVLPMDSPEKNFYFKWNQSIAGIDYPSFKPGKQIVNHILNIRKILGTKSGLAFTLHKQRYAIWQKFKVSLEDFYPETYRLNVLADLIKFVQSQTKGLWLKKTVNNVGEI